nr:uncharacterized protein LOC127309742 [Lolium perenne]
MDSPRREAAPPRTILSRRPVRRRARAPVARRAALRRTRRPRRARGRRGLLHAGEVCRPSRRVRAAAFFLRLVSADGQTGGPRSALLWDVAYRGSALVLLPIHQLLRPGVHHICWVLPWDLGGAAVSGSDKARGIGAVQRHWRLDCNLELYKGTGGLAIIWLSSTCYL